ncbi:acetyl/propionyl/methylcrotonyl-CoA carboxylase subunit alpha [Nocardioides sp.]|uniref:acetyl/propionyl/methylcrotonyl-CoA carboxylase subunit alpha n=1 Tax=Nocardioides sp. TaxID=35761 RepID=UPI002D80D511|nr:biotin carboxylase N-terminal domain-containing protein [Nocardioides sp.]HET8959725.1 biotin carboxylase N-terminal domain-containing protein [Nocardioides sp.]
MIHTLLIANRGEIALRVIRTCRALGVRSIAIFTELDRQAPHVREADDALHVTSYLDIEAVVTAAREGGADAIHPGYGFLSERAGFARAVEAAGLILVGPSADVMDQMGRKDAAREIAIAAGVPVVPQGDDASYPVLVKAAAGGGGKGMRIVRSADAHADAVAAAKREAQAAFGDDTMLVEKYVEHGRHIEVQVLADAHGNVVHLYERDCSTQRRHQKVLEEAPAPTISEEQRKLVTDAAVALAAHVGYQNAGTVEFLLDTEPAPGDSGVYFLEMNTRLQVEHPVTELAVQVRGRPVDLVELQLRVAAGEELPFTQDDVALSAHAIEARVYAEDPFHGFLPQAGRAVLVRWPPRARVDAALESGQEVSTAYDPMLGKVIVHGPDREAARRALVAALDDTAILGLTTNVGFLRILAAGDEFRDATIDTAWLDHAEVTEPDAALARVYAAWTSVAVLTMTSGDPHPFSPDGFRTGADPAAVLVELDRPVRVDRGAGRVDDGERVWQVEEHLAADHTVVLTVDGSRCRAVANVTAHAVEVVLHGHRHVFERPDVFADHGPAAGDGSISAPMPGTVLDVRVEPGQPVAEGDVLGTMEAMKMELSLTAPFAGTVTAVDASAGEQVALGARLFLVEGPEVE